MALEFVPNIERKEEREKRKRADFVLYEKLI